MANYRITHNLGELVQAFMQAPAQTRDLVRLQLGMAARDISESASRNHAYTSRSGILERSGVVSHLTNTTATISLNPSVKYAVFVHEGSKPHDIVARNKQVLRFVSRGNMVFTKRVHHPGTSPDPFLYAAAEREMPKIQSRFEGAIEALLEGMQ